MGVYRTIFIKVGFVCFVGCTPRRIKPKIIKTTRVAGGIQNTIKYAKKHNKLYIVGNNPDIWLNNDIIHLVSQKYREKSI